VERALVQGTYIYIYVFTVSFFITSSHHSSPVSSCRSLSAPLLYSFTTSHHIPPAAFSFRPSKSNPGSYF
jgi:hypothetical protein